MPPLRWLLLPLGARAVSAVGDGQPQGVPGRENGSQGRNPALDIARAHGWTGS